MRTAEPLFRALNALPVSIVILDTVGKIVTVNDNWKTFGKANGLKLRNFGIGAKYLQHCDANNQDGLADNLRRLLTGTIDLLTLAYPCHSPSQKRWFFMIGMPLSIDKTGGSVLFHVNLTDVISAIDGTATGSSLAADASLAQADMVGRAMQNSVERTLFSQLTEMIAAVREPPFASGKGPILVKPVGAADLSKRQLDVLRLLGEGKTNAEIAKSLLRSPNTVKLHVSAILRRLNLSSRTQAALLASKLFAHASNEAQAGPRLMASRIARAAVLPNRKLGKG